MDSHIVPASPSLPSSPKVTINYFGVKVSLKFNTLYPTDQEWRDD